jgi:large subunit ribosomal protein L29
MKDLKANDLRAKSVDELKNMELEERAALYKVRRDFVFRQTSDTSGVKTRRHNIARILTIIGEKERGQA